jgi:hypothetical protein
VDEKQQNLTCEVPEAEFASVGLRLECRAEARPWRRSGLRNFFEIGEDSGKTNSLTNGTKGPHAPFPLADNNARPLLRRLDVC